MLPVAQLARRHCARAIVQDAAGNEHYYLLHWTDETAAEVLASFIHQSSLPGHPLTPTLAGGFIAALRADGRVTWPTVCEAYKLAHQRQMAEAAAIVYGESGGTPINTSNHARDGESVAAVEPAGEKATALDDAESSPAVGSDHRHGWQDREAPARRRSRARVFLLGFVQALAVGAAIAAFIFSFAWGD